MDLKVRLKSHAITGLDPKIDIFNKAGQRKFATSFRGLTPLANGGQQKLI